MSTEEDRQLVAECLHGNASAFGKIVDKYQKPVFNIALRITNRWDDAEDVAQTAFIKAYENLRDYDGSRKLFSWLYRIAVNEALNFRNAKKDHGELTDTIHSSDKGPDDTAYELQRNQSIEQAIMQLSEDYRVTVVLRHFQDLTYHEISDVLHIPEKTVKSRLFTARQLLKSLLVKADVL